MAGGYAERIGRAYASFNSGDTAWVRGFVVEDVEWGTTGAFPGMARVYRGFAGVEEWIGTVRSEWERFEVSLDEVIGEADDELAVVERIWGRGRGSGAEGEMRVYCVYRFNPDGRVAKRRAFTSREEAAAALRQG